jgi:hypothetical protein
MVYLEYFYYVQLIVLYQFVKNYEGPGDSMLGYLTTHTSLSPIRRGFAPGFINYKKGCTPLAVASDKVYQLLGPWSVVLSGYSGFFHH